tara:strand:- start:2417 stop:2692 length:276 start_codon:yes stop_codon:yes gene_type:complete
VGVKASEDDSSQTSCGVDARVPTTPNWLADITQEGVGVAKKRQTFIVALVCLKPLCLGFANAHPNPTLFVFSFFFLKPPGFEFDFELSLSD